MSFIIIVLCPLLLMQIGICIFLSWRWCSLSKRILDKPEPSERRQIAAQIVQLGQQIRFLEYSLSAFLCVTGVALFAYNSDDLIFPLLCAVGVILLLWSPLRSRTKKTKKL